MRSRDASGAETATDNLINVSDGRGFDTAWQAAAASVPMPRAPPLGGFGGLPGFIGGGRGRGEALPVRPPPTEEERAIAAAGRANFERQTARLLEESRALRGAGSSGAAPHHAAYARSAAGGSFGGVGRGTAVGPPFSPAGESSSGFATPTLGRSASLGGSRGPGSSAGRAADDSSALARALARHEERQLWG